MRLPNIPPPEPGSKAEREDLLRVIRQYMNKKVPESLQEACDKHMSKIFQQYVEDQGLVYNWNAVKRVHNGLRPLIFRLKEVYKRPRPADVAKRYGIDFSGDYLETAQSPSYPSGHTIQAYVQALLLSNLYPDHSENLLKIADMIAQSRIDRGVHFPTDVEFGKKLAYLISRELIDG